MTSLLVMLALFVDRAVTRQRTHEAQLLTEQLRRADSPSGGVRSLV
jgi:hypothetical protein